MTVVDLAETPVGTFDPDIGQFVADAIRGLGIDLVLGDGAAAVRDERRSGVAPCTPRAAASCPPTWWCSVSASARTRRWPRTPASRSVPSGGIEIDRRMHTSVAGVWAAGDCVESLHRLSGRRVVVALGTHANKQGRVVGINIGGGYATFPGVIGTAVTKVCDLEVARTGLSEKEATEAGFGFVTTSVDSTTRAGYFPGARAIRVKLIAERRYRSTARRADRRPGGCRQAHRRAGDRGLERDDRRRSAVAWTCRTHRRSHRSGIRC